MKPELKTYKNNSDITSFLCYKHLPFYYISSHQIHQAQLIGMTPFRVPLPLDFTKEEPVFVNAKQYHAILRRRKYRLKLESQNKINKIRKVSECIFISFLQQH